MLAQLLESILVIVRRLATNDRGRPDVARNHASAGRIDCIHLVFDRRVAVLVADLRVRQVGHAAPAQLVLLELLRAFDKPLSALQNGSISIQ